MTAVYLVAAYCSGILTIPAIGGVLLYRRKRRFDRKYPAVR